MSESLDLRTLRTLLVACSLGVATLATTGLIVTSEARVPSETATADAACAAHETGVKAMVAVAGEFYASAWHLPVPGARQEPRAHASGCARVELTH